jgi:hypothetical protein
MTDIPFSLPQRRGRRGPVLRVALAAFVAGALLAGAQATFAPPAQAKVTIGIGQQSPDMFASPYWRALKAPSVRYVTPWDTLSDPYQLARLNQWLFTARLAHADVMIALRGSMKNARAARKLPTTTQFRRAFLGFRKFYPWVRNWVPWNETNHPTALTGNRPGRAAAYFNIVTRYCKRCNVAAGDVLDISNVRTWIARYKRHLKTRPRIWSIHNYHDANAMTDKGVRALLSTVRGKIWLTETGGLVKFRVKNGRKVSKHDYGIKHAARSTKYVLGQARRYHRIQRIYLYNWNAPKPFTTWDSGLFDTRSHPRPAYRALRSWLHHARRIRLAR